MWIKERNTVESSVILRELAVKCGELGGPVSKRLAAIAIVDLSLLHKESLDYQGVHSDIDVQDAMYASQILALVQKSRFIEPEKELDLDLVAAKRFVQSERNCLETNRRLSRIAAHPQYCALGIESLMFMAQRKIARVLGTLPPLEKLDFSFGPGANTNVKSSQACPRVKLGAALECSSDMSPTVGKFLEETPAWLELHNTALDITHDVESADTFIVNVNIVPGKLTFVPKNAKTNRSIVIEPIVNSIFQKGVGSYIKRRLKRFNIDLSDQERNQNMAREGSESGNYATLDLSMASDCISKELVWSLLPFEWAQFLSELRTGEVTLPKSITPDICISEQMEAYMQPDSTYSLQKFSSMGNGFTFELESLIFYGLCSAVCELASIDITEIGVYGDDLIVPTSIHGTVTELLNHCGFSLNTDKSFWQGPFRESCGADYFKGFDIRPFFQKTRISDQSLFVMHNWFVRHSEFELAEIAKSFVHPTTLLYGPDGFGDGHLIGSHQLRYNRNISRDGWGGGYFDSYCLKPKKFKKPQAGDKILPVYSVYVRSGKDSPTDPDTVRGSVGYRRISIYTLGSSIFSRKD